MPPTKRNQSARRAPKPKQTVPEPAIQSSTPDDDGDVTRWLAGAQPTVAHVRAEPGPTEEARTVAYAVHSHQDRRDVRFEPLPGVTLMFGYSGLSRVLNGIHHVHIATLDEMAAMDEQAFYDAVLKAGGKR